MIDKIDRKIMNDTEYMALIAETRRDQEHESFYEDCSDSGSDLYWFYKRYRQSMEALESTEASSRNSRGRKRPA
jgi:hypothetical protein